MSENRRVYAPDFKRKAIELSNSPGRSVSDVAKELGIIRATLDRWRREAKEENGTKKAFTGQGNSRDEEMAKLRRENADLRETNEILKKAMVIFTQRSPR